MEELERWEDYMEAEGTSDEESKKEGGSSSDAEVGCKADSEVLHNDELGVEIEQDVGDEESPNPRDTTNFGEVPLFQSYVGEEEA